MAKQVAALISPATANNQSVGYSTLLVNNTAGAWVNPMTNVQWQQTSSNATYCSASSALALT